MLYVHCLQIIKSVQLKQNTFRSEVEEANCKPQGSLLVLQRNDWLLGLAGSYMEVNVP
jgi:hypothetical protein